MATDKLYYPDEEYDDVYEDEFTDVKDEESDAWYADEFPSDEFGDEYLDESENEPDWRVEDFMDVPLKR